MIHDNMDLSRFIVHVQQVEDNRKKKAFLMLVCLILKIRQVPSMDVRETILASLSSPGSKRGHRFQGALTLRGVQHLEKTDPSLGRAMR